MMVKVSRRICFCGFFIGTAIFSILIGAGNITASFALSQQAPLSSLVAVPVSSEQISLSWSDSTDNETGFSIERREGTVGVYYQIATVPFDAVSYSDSGLKPDTTYYYRIQSLNAGIGSPYSSEALATTMPSLPEAPASLAAVAISSHQIMLTWTDMAVNESGYAIMGRRGSCESGWRWTQMASEAADETSSFIGRLTPDTVYAFKIRAYNSAGRAPASKCVTARTGPEGTPFSPKQLTATSVSADKIKLNWQNSSTDETRIEIYRRGGTGDWGLLGATGAGSESYLDASDLTNSAAMSYSYYIQACNSYGCSPPTNQAVVPVRPSGLSASVVSSAEIDLSWLDTVGIDAGKQIWRKGGECLSPSGFEMIEGGQTGASFVNYGLTPGTTYSYRIRALTRSSSKPYAYGYTFFSNCISATTITPTLLSITVKPSVPRIVLSDIQQFKALGNYSDGTQVDLTASAVWNSSDATTVTFDTEGAPGLATPHALGYSTITASRDGVSGTAALTVAESLPANIILVLTDDQTSGDRVLMPKLQSLITDPGAGFNNAFVTTSLCCPSRTSILRGQYGHNHNVKHNVLPAGGFVQFDSEGLGDSTVASWLQDAGYRTALIGKFLNSYPDPEKPMYIPPGWDEWQAWYHMPAKGSYHYYNYDINENGTIVHYGDSESDYLTDVLANKAVDFIQKATSFNRPFFLYVAPHAPHFSSDSGLPFPAPTPPVRYQDDFQNLTAPRPPSFNEADVSDKPIEIQNLPLLDDIKIGSLDFRYRLRAQSLKAVDDLVERIVETLSSTGQLERTYIFFMSDNGYEIGEHRIELGKGNCYEEAVRVPLVVRGPGIPAGLTLDHLVLNIDLAPTFAGIAETPVPAFVDGRSLLDMLHGVSTPAYEWRRAFIVETWNNRGQITNKALRGDGFKYVRHATTGEIEFYDLINDPYELQSLTNTMDQGLLQKYSDRLEALSNCAGQNCRDTENLPPPDPAVGR